MFLLRFGFLCSFLETLGFNLESERGNGDLLAPEIETVLWFVIKSPRITFIEESSNKCAGWLRELSGINEAKSHAVRESYSYFAAAPLVTGIMGELK